MLLGSEQVPPESASVIVSVVVAPVPVAEQLLKPLPRMIVPGLGATKPAVKVTVIVSPVFRAPVALEVKFAVQVARALAARDVLLTVTLVGGVAAATVAAVSLTVVVSALVLTVSVVAPAVGFVMPTICTEVAVLAARAHVPALSASVIVTVWPEPMAVAEQLAN